MCREVFITVNASLSALNVFDDDGDDGGDDGGSGH